MDWRGGTEPAEVRQAIEQVRLFIEQNGESRFELWTIPARPVNNRAGWRKGSGPDRE
jgi:putative DNA primase/helicase